MAYTKTEQYDSDITEKLIRNYKDTLFHLGEDPEREGLLKNTRTCGKSHAIYDAGLPG